MKDIKKEVAGIFSLAFGLILLLSLISYSPFDPSFSTYSTSMVEVKNWCGRFGAYSSDLLIQWFGIGSAVVPLIFFFQSYLLFKGYGFGRVAVRSLAILLSLVAGVSLISMYGGYVKLFGVDIFLSGLVGYAIGMGLIHAVLGSVGGAIFLLTLFSVFLIVSTGVTFGDLREALARKREKKKRVREKIKEDMTGKGKIDDLLEPPLEDFSAEEIKIFRGGTEKKRRKKEKIRRSGDFVLPPLELLDEPPLERNLPDEETLRENARILLNELRQFGVDGEITSVKAGPMVTLYEFKPAPGKKLSSIVKLSEDLALALKAESLRIIKNIPGRGVMGIEVPNHQRERVYLREIIESRAYQDSKSPLTIAVGLDILGNSVVADLSKMPHLLIAGTTGSGKSVALNSMILSLLYRTTPEEMRLILVDPKMLEFNPYDGIPNLLHPVVTQPRDASKVLKWAVMEMESRYRLMMENGVRNINSYNALVNRRRKSAGTDDDVLTPMPYIVIVIDELSDLMLSSAREVEESITRLSQMARASGIHLIVATQRPSVDVITGVIKANFPCRVSFKVSSRYDSYTILGEYGAELLLGQGDMLFLRPGPERMIRVHAPYVSEDEVRRVISHLKGQAEAMYEESILSSEREDIRDEVFDDEKYEEAVNLVLDTGKVSISYIQRKLGIGFNRAARIVERMEEEGIVTPPGPGGKGRQVRLRRGDEKG